MSSQVSVLLGIDGGSTKTAVRVTALDGSWSVVSEYRGAGTNLHKYEGGTYTSKDRTQLGRDHLDQAIANALSVTAEDGRGSVDAFEIVAICIGTAGIDVAGDRVAFKQVFRGCRHLRHLSAKQIVVKSDVEIIAECSDAAIRLCLIAGTGSNCYGVRTDHGRKEEAFVGGLDLPLTDDGSAAWIATLACKEARRLANIELINHPLVRGIYGALGIDLTKRAAWRQIKTAFAQLGKSQLAALCETVVAPLAESDCREAKEILQSASEELGLMAKSALSCLEVDTLDSIDVLLVGGVWKNETVLENFRGYLTQFIRSAYPPCLRNAYRTASKTIRIVDPTLGAVKIARSLV
ncbi:hypothetical protein HZA87_02320 [Candidatus Uhrbacteria bacterium]|nr:hypothetical protein [Candidatus Uhrbacteria bacterium]